MTAVIMDLSTVGGSYYACLLPQNIPYCVLLDFALPQTSFSDEQLLATGAHWG